MISEKKFDLEDRLINYAVLLLKMTQKLPDSEILKPIKSQIVRSGTSPASNYGEAQCAESRSDFIHKLKIALKELRETRVWLLIIQRFDQFENSEQLIPLLRENDELISILFRCIDTAKKI